MASDWPDDRVTDSSGSPLTAIRLAVNVACLAASGRVYAAYGGLYVATALVWLTVVDRVRLSALDWPGAGIVLSGMLIIVLGWHTKGLAYDFFRFLSRPHIGPVEIIGAAQPKLDGVPGRFRPSTLTIYRGSAPSALPGGLPEVFKPTKMQVACHHTSRENPLSAQVASGERLAPCRSLNGGRLLAS